MPVLALRLFTPFSGRTDRPGPVPPLNGEFRRALGGSRVLSVRRSAITDTVTGFSLQRGEKLRQGSRCFDRQPQGEPLIRETTRKDAYEDRKGHFLPAPYLPYEASVFRYAYKTR